MSDVKRYAVGSYYSEPRPGGITMVMASDYDALKARLAAVEDECADLIAGKEYQAMQRTLGEVNARLAEAERVLRICANFPPSGMRPQDAKGFFKGFIPAEQRAAREYFTARATDSADPVMWVKSPQPCGCCTATDGFGNRQSYVCAAHRQVETVTTSTVDGSTADQPSPTDSA